MDAVVSARIILPLSGEHQPRLRDEASRKAALHRFSSLLLVHFKLVAIAPSFVDVTMFSSDAIVGMLHVLLSLAPISLSFFLVWRRNPQRHQALLCARVVLCYGACRRQSSAAGLAFVLN
jgi:hypothetical protein